MNAIRRIVLASIAAAIAVSSVSCNTIRGVGRDIEKGGEAIQRSVDKSTHD